MEKIIESIKKNKWLVIILIIASILRLYKINFQSLWMDEIYTLNITNPQNSFGTVISEVNNREGFPYLYFLLIKIGHIIFGYTPLVARVFSALLGIFSVYAISILGQKLYNKNTGIIAALLLCFSEYAIYISQDARPYSLYLLVVIISYVGLIDFIKEPNKNNAIKFGIIAGILLNTNFFGLVNLLAQFFIVVLFFIVTDKEEKLDFVKKSFIAAGIAVLLFLPNIYKLTTLFGVKAPWIPLPAQDSLTLLLKEFLGNSEITIFFFTPIFTYFLINIFNVKKFKNKKAFTFTILFTWCFTVVAFIFFMSHLSSSLLIPRYFTSLLAPILLILATGFAFIKSSIVRSIFLFGLILFMFFNFTVVRGYYKGPNKTQFREASTLIINKNINNEPVYTSLKYWFDFYLKDKFIVEEKTSLEAVILEMMQDSTKVKAFWYTDAHGRPFVLSENAQQFVNDNFHIDDNFDGFDAWTKHFILLKDAKKEISISKYLPLQIQNGSSFAYSIEFFENKDNLVTASGWAYFEGIDATESVIELLLIKDNNCRAMLTQKVSRPDVTTYFKSNFDLSNSGFISKIKLSGLDKGVYKIAVLVINKTAEKEGLIISDRSIVID